MTGEGDGEDRCKMTGAVLSDVRLMSPGGRLTASILTTNPQSKKSNQASSASLCMLDYVFFSGKATYLLIDVLLEGRPTSCTQDNIEVTGVQKKASSHVTCSVTFGYNVSVGYYLTQGLRAWHKALFWLSVHQQTLYWEVEMPFFCCKNQAPRVNTSTIMCWIVLISNVVW